MFLTFLHRARKRFAIKITGFFCSYCGLEQNVATYALIVAAFFTSLYIGFVVACRYRNEIFSLLCSSVLIGKPLDHSLEARCSQPTASSMWRR